MLYSRTEIRVNKKGIHIIDRLLIIFTIKEFVPLEFVSHLESKKEEKIMTYVYRISPRRKRKTLSVTTQLIIANLILYIVGLFLFAIYGEEFLLNNIALTPALVLSGQKIWTFLTSMFFKNTKSLFHNIFHHFVHCFILIQFPPFPVFVVSVFHHNQRRNQ